MIIPAPLQKGDLIQIVSPAGKIDPKLVEPAVELLERSGYRVGLGAHLLSQHFQYSGTDAERLADLQEAINNPEVRCILCSRGGYGSIRIAASLDFSALKTSPKWLVGFSDITVLHSLIQHQDIASIHGPMLKGLGNTDSVSVRNLLGLLRGKGQSYLLPADGNNRCGSVSAAITGGNLSVLYSLLGTPMFPETEGRILFIEDLNEYLYHTDRMMHSLKYSGVLDKLAGLIVGSFSDMLDNKNPFGKNAYQIIAEHVAGYSYPVCFGFPAGHIDDNRPLLFGATCRFSVSDDCAELEF